FCIGRRKCSITNKTFYH
ncbi:hypothetical protein QUC31_002602, partial [Theobroma cacao]